jgi:hypothetical protein
MSPARTPAHALSISGNGGKVIAWGNESAQVHGSIHRALAAHCGGDGGLGNRFHYLAADGIRVSIPVCSGRGKRGNWLLLDPFDIDVACRAVAHGRRKPVRGGYAPPVAPCIGADTIAASSNVTAGPATASISLPPLQHAQSDTRPVK